MAETISEMDQRAIAASLNGDGEAYARLVQHYRDQVFAPMWRFTRDTAVLEELVQEVFVEAYLSLKGFRGRAPFLHWLCKGVKSALDSFSFHLNHLVESRADLTPLCFIQQPDRIL